MLQLFTSKTLFYFGIYFHITYHLEQQLYLLQLRHKYIEKMTSVCCEVESLPALGR